MKCIVTGGGGFIGSNLVDYLISKNHEVFVIDNFCSGSRSNINSSAKVLEVDISDSSSSDEITSFMKGGDCVFHLAAMPKVQPSIDDPVDFEKNNTIGTINILKCAVDAKVKRVIYSASSSAYGNTTKIPMLENDKANPISPYAMQKLYGEIACKMFSQVYGIETVSLRL